MDEQTDGRSLPELREIDLDSLKGLAHPLRVRIVDVLSSHGSLTASGLAERLGESSGATSYHLRQLERHGFVREVTGKGTGRERWWERMPGGITISDRTITDTPTGRAASSLVLTQWEQNRSQLVLDFAQRGWDILPHEWTDPAVFSSSNLRLTAEQLAEVSGAIEQFLEDIVERFRGKDAPGARPVLIHFDAFPIVDGVATPTED
ncbi:helix-turn-helix transcriptional regulator [Glaciihabitans sp. INWT7]|uniref:ArsR/SmtB family transcription factor n=1 Tax=Glaciihabitans sp. INWT7 TaxID=2596912 RepID=UPI00162785A2|nr:helix-turn-helix domain-containing protein [Glaciihabitans sp. INWT7]QNE47167.1 helix-turn-helix transcriptional regulator [Glaciihabitans sp. INWT7]